MAGFDDDARERFFWRNGAELFGVSVAVNLASPRRRRPQVMDTGGSRIDAVLAEERRHLRRVLPADLAAEVAAGALVVDTRPSNSAA